MSQDIPYIGLDVHKRSIAAAARQPGAAVHEEFAQQGRSSSPADPSAR